MASPLSTLIYGNPRLFRYAMNLYPPLVGAGIRVRSVSADFREVVVELRRTRFNGNAFGTHFGGSLYAMTDPFYCLMFVANLGADYVIWDAAAKIDFERPGRGTITARFQLDQTDVDRVKAETAAGTKYMPSFVVELLDAQGERVARVEKTLYIRRKRSRRPTPRGAAAAAG